MGGQTDFSFASRTCPKLHHYHVLCAKLFVKANICITVHYCNKRENIRAESGLTPSTLGKISADDSLKYFFYFSQETGFDISDIPNPGKIKILSFFFFFFFFAC